MNNRQEFREIVDMYHISCFLKIGDLVLYGILFDVSFSGFGCISNLEVVKDVKGVFDLETLVGEEVHIFPGIYYLMEGKTIFAPSFRKNEINELVYNNIIGPIIAEIQWVDEKQNRLGFLIKRFPVIVDKSKWERIIWKIHLYNCRTKAETRDVREVNKETKNKNDVGQKIVYCVAYGNGYCRLVNKTVGCKGNRLKCDLDKK